MKCFHAAKIDFPSEGGADVRGSSGIEWGSITCGAYAHVELCLCCRGRRLFDGHAFRRRLFQQFGDVVLRVPFPMRSQRVRTERTGDCVGDGSLARYLSVSSIASNAGFVPM